MNELIKITYDGNNTPTVSARELHEFLEVKTPLKDWFPRMCEYGFTEGMDFRTFLSESTGGRPAQDAEITLDMAKELAMIQRNEKGKQARTYFIAAEKAYRANLTLPNDLSPQLQLLINIEREQKQQALQLNATNTKLDAITDIIALDTNAWRTDCRKMITRIATALGGMDRIRDVNTMAYELLDKRFGVSLAARLNNLRARMAVEGVCKSKQDKVTKVDVIAADKKLIEGYIAIVKELAVKHGVWKNAETS